MLLARCLERAHSLPVAFALRLKLVLKLKVSSARWFSSTQVSVQPSPLHQRALSARLEGKPLTLWSERIAAPSGQNARKEHIRLPTDKQRINAVVAAFSCCGTGVAPSLITPTSMDPKQSKDPRR